MSVAEIMNNLVPVYLIFALGYLLKRFKITTVNDARAIFLIVYNALTPAIFLYSIPRIEITLELLKYPLFTASFHFLALVLGIQIHKRFKLKMDKVVFVASMMIINLGFLFPFYVSKYGYDDVWQHSLFELGNATVVFFLVQYFYIEKKVSLSSLHIKGALKLLKSPPIISIILGLIINFLGISYPKAIENFLYKLVVLNGSLVMLGLGVYFAPKMSLFKDCIKIILIKITLGLLITIILNLIFKFEGSAKTLAFLVATSPVGTSNITFSVIHGSNKQIEFTSALVSLSLVIGMVVSSIVLILI